MKYSILVLGASISISLFIRICCSLEANLDQTENLFFGRADEVYKKFLKHSLLNGVKQNKNLAVNAISSSSVDRIVDDWMKEINSLRASQGLLHKNPATKITSKLGIKRDIKDELCGSTKPPNVDYNECNNDTHGCAVEGFEEWPSGCKFNETDQTLLCRSEGITAIPQKLPPIISTLVLNETKIEKITEMSFRNVSIKYIQILRNSIDYIHPWSFHDIDELTGLMIVGNKLTHLAYDLYVGLNDTTQLDLSYNQISLEIYEQCSLLDPDKIAKVLPKLRWLQFSGNPLKTIPKQMFAGLRESPVITLYLDNCYLENISEEAFSYFKNLVILNLSDNPSSMVQPMEKFAKILEPLTSLKTLYLQNLGFADFPIVALANISNHLTTFDLSKNNIHTIRRNVMSKFSELEELYLDECSIQVIEDNAFSENNRLKVLSLYRNKLQNLPAYFPMSLTYLNITNIEINSQSSELRLQNMPELKILVMSAFKINKIYSSSFQQIPNLTKIFMKGCDIQTIEDGAFQDLKKLTLLYLDNNPISLRPEIFLGLDSLRVLSMSNCGLSLDSPVSSSQSKNSSFTANARNPFKFLPQLDELDLSSNKIVNISADLFENLTKLRYILLANNPIEEWDTRLFPDRIATIYDEVAGNTTFLVDLSLRNGNVQFMKDAMFEDFLRVTTIDISNNDLVCDQGACKLRDIIGIKPSKQRWINSLSYKCVDIKNSKSIYISELTDDVCSNYYEVEPSVPGPSPSSSSITPSSSSAMTTIISVIASLILVAAVIIILAYKNRAQLHYLWFTVKFKVMSASPRKAKLSTMEASTWNYDYDVFISYHHDDSNFIENVLLPEIEMQDSMDESEVFEAKNSIYVIEHDVATVKCNNNNTNPNPKTNTPRFKVCLHERDFAAGVPITENIVDCVDRSRKTIIFVSKLYMDSQWCSYELNLVYHRLVESRRKSFLLVLMEEIPTDSRTKVLNFLMVSKTYLQWPGVVGLEEEKASFWKRLRAFLQSG